MRGKFWISVLIVSVIGCKKPYNPHIAATTTNYLVVEGVINTGSDSTIIKLSRTVTLSSGVTVNPERNAVMNIESDASASFSLTEIRSGYYVAVGLNLDNGRKYRLRIKTNAGSQSGEYLSDFIPVTPTPPVDSVGYQIQANGIQVYVNTHDPKNSTHYYRWDYQETWKFHSKYGSEYISDGTKIVPRTPEQRIFTCWGNTTSSTIVLGSSAKLAQDVIYQSPITRVVSTSEKIEAEYSILVKQYALSVDAYNFWANLKKNTEQLGSIFDGEPSNITGNIHNTTNPSEPVIGYISACNVQTKRIFIFSEDLPHAWQPIYPYDCAQDTSLYCKGKLCEDEVQEKLIPLHANLIPTTAITKLGLVIGFLGSDAECVDCSIRGTTIQPAFWK